MPDKAVDYKVTIGDIEVSAATYANISRIVFEERFFETSHVEITIKDGLHFDLTPEQIKFGTKIEIELGYVGDLVKVFEGQIVEVAPSGDGGGVDSLQITAYDYSHLLKLEHPGRTFTETNLLDIVKEIVTDSKGKREDKVSLVAVIDPEDELRKMKIMDDASINQEGQTDWEVLTDLANRLNYKLLCRFNEVMIVRLDRIQADQSVDHKYIFERNLFDTYKDGVYPLVAFNPRVSSVEQRTNVEVVSFDPFKSDGKRIAYESLAGLGRDVSGYTDIKVNTEATETIRVLGIARTPGEARTMAQSELRRRAEQLVKGDARVMGNPYIRAGQKHTIIYSAFRDIGKQFSGEYTIKGVRHQIDSDGLLTTEFDVMRERLTQP